MLKKLIKYGNSQALLLNRSILGLLGIADGDTVKLRIEGDVLLITKCDNNLGKQQEIQAAFEAEIKKEEENHKKYLDGAQLQKEVIENYSAMLKNDSFDPSRLEDLHDSPKFKEGIKNFKAIEKKHGLSYADLSKKMVKDKEYMKGMALLAEKRKEMDADDFIQEVMGLRYKHFPELKALDDEARELDDLC